MHFIVITLKVAPAPYLIKTKRRMHDMLIVLLSKLKSLKSMRENEI